jgi:hypothetical protein
MVGIAPIFFKLLLLIHFKEYPKNLQRTDLGIMARGGLVSILQAPPATNYNNCIIIKNKNMEQTIAKPQLPNFFSLLKECFQVYRSKWRILLLLFLVSHVIYLSSATIIAMVIAIPAVLVNMFFESKELFWVIIGLLFLTMIILITIISSWLQAGIIMALSDRAEVLGIREILRRAKPFIFPYIWISLINLPIIILGFIFFAIPGIIFSTWFLFAEYILISENKKGIDAIATSREYVRGCFGKILLLVLIAGFLMFFCYQFLNRFPKICQWEILFIRQFQF